MPDADEAAREAAWIRFVGESETGSPRRYEFMAGWDAGRAFERERAEALAAAAEMLLSIRLNGVPWLDEKGVAVLREALGAYRSERGA